MSQSAPQDTKWRGAPRLYTISYIRPLKNSVKQNLNGLERLYSAILRHSGSKVKVIFEAAAAMANQMIPPPQPHAAPAPDVPAATPKIRQSQSFAGVYIMQNTMVVGDGSLEKKEN